MLKESKIQLERSKKKKNIPHPWNAASNPSSDSSPAIDDDDPINESIKIAKQIKNPQKIRKILKIKHAINESASMEFDIKAKDIFRRTQEAEIDDIDLHMKDDGSSSEVPFDDNYSGKHKLQTSDSFDINVYMDERNLMASSIGVSSDAHGLKHIYEEELMSIDCADEDEEKNFVLQTNGDFSPGNMDDILEIDTDSIISDVERKPGIISVSKSLNYSPVAKKQLPSLYVQQQQQKMGVLEYYRKLHTNTPDSTPSRVLPDSPLVYTNEMMSSSSSRALIDNQRRSQNRRRNSTNSVTDFYSDPTPEKRKYFRNDFSEDEKHFVANGVHSFVLDFFFQI